MTIIPIADLLRVARWIQRLPIQHPHLNFRPRFMTRFQIRRLKARRSISLPQGSQGLPRLLRPHLAPRLGKVCQASLPQWALRLQKLRQQIRTKQLQHCLRVTASQFRMPLRSRGQGRLVRPSLGVWPVMQREFLEHLAARAHSCPQVQADCPPSRLLSRIAKGSALADPSNPNLLRKIVRTSETEATTKAMGKETSSWEKRRLILVSNTKKVCYSNVCADCHFLTAPADTGEEGEDSVFTSSRAKLYGFEGSWKERGAGTFKLNVAMLSSDDSDARPKKARFIMRAHQTFRILLNSPVLKKLKIEKFKTSKKTLTIGVWEDGKLVPYLITVGSFEDQIIDQVADVIIPVKQRE